ncbi:transcriptional regulator NrdR [Anaerofustis stercorihominis]|uniref:Transcriptional repressor NrdR n=2 Tax=Anaerofustis stercorihominis TaxID=214853 RepID=B1C6J6_9FIRM|nr:transcriptional regulator NrdR [Anaerofustis stercorihominis]EDS73481.1 transcriptional regulator NrdR [Anaerofustis stercorihominis DSM 17244]MCQ4794994.1 transcriptional regulator NrdR [Anaerofustis stercorihominis]MCR2033498.1 transcriptional regulator NrdR [Anaerofustis stercorihominis]RGD75439.1 transcriptional repressor NrdR [Anaerofustis stercorihominis]
MKCPHCGYIESKVIDSRPTDDNTAIRRRRECLSCAQRFTTYEKVETIPLIVVKKNGTRESFDRNKLMNGIIKSCEKRPVSIEQIEHMVNDIESEIQKIAKKEVSSTVIGEEIMKRLKDVDEVAYVRFASVYRQFKDVNSFMDELKTMLSDRGNK